MIRPTKTMITLLAVLVPIAAVAWYLGLRYLNFDTMKQWVVTVQHFSTKHMLLTAVVLLLLQTVGMIFSLPTKALLTMSAGALLGISWGSLVTLGGVMLGTTVLFVGVQYFFQEWAAAQMGSTLKRWGARLHQRPTLTVAGLRLILTLPFGVITIAAAIAQIPYKKFLAGSLLGDLPVVLLYAAAGTQLASLTTRSEAVSWQTVVILSGAGVALVLATLWPKKRQESSDTMA